MALVGTATGANAASVVTGPTPLDYTPPASGLFGAVLSGSADMTTGFDDTFTFNIIGGPGVANAQVSTILLNGAQNVNFTSILLDGLYAFTKTAGDGSPLNPVPETWALAPVQLGNGAHTIEVVGSLLGPTGSYSGTLNVAAVPEPATWAMMLIGFGAIGFSMRRRPRATLAQVA